VNTAMKLGVPYKVGTFVRAHLNLASQKILFYGKDYFVVNTVTDLINALPGNSSLNTVQHATTNESVFSMSSEPSSGGTTGLCNPFLSNVFLNTLPRKR
jgi:hypothetical protein